MATRRDIVKQTLLLSAGMACGAGSFPLSARPRVSPALAHRVTGVSLQDATIRRLGGLGDGYKATWAADGRQFLAVNDGPGWTWPPRAMYNSRVWTITGGPAAPRFADLAGYPDLDMGAHPDAPKYHGHGLLWVGGRLIQFLATLDRAEDRPRHWIGAKLIYSDDGGRTWRNQDGTTPVRFESFEQQSRRTLAFFDEPDGCFSLLSILQMGRGYRANRDGFIYIYGLNGNTDGLMNQLMLLRVPIAQVLDRSAYRFFAGRSADGSATWSGDLAQRAPVHTFPRGWVNSANVFPGDLVLESWLPSVVFNEALGLYVMASTGVGCGPDGTAYGKPSYLGFWVSEQPWGPWRQVHENRAWTPGGDAGSLAYSPQIIPGWTSADGTAMHIAWADLKGMLAFGRDEGKLEDALKQAKSPRDHNLIEAEFLRRYIPGFAFNTQRVDLTLG